MVGKTNFEGKDITVKKTDNSFVRGICLVHDSSGIILEIKGSNRLVFIPLQQISEIFTENRDEDDQL
jgi:ABC-type branched-subunit amino acid transport system ATPase component